MNTATQILSELTRSLVADRFTKIRATTARIATLQTRPLRTSAHEVREQAVQLLARAQEFAKLNSYPEQDRADITLHLRDICLPLERYYGTSDQAMEFDLTCHLHRIACALDQILLSDPTEDVPNTGELQLLLEGAHRQFQPLLRAC